MNVYVLRIIPKLNFHALDVICIHTLSGRPGGYPDDNFRNKKLKKIKKCCKLKCIFILSDNREL